MNPENEKGTPFDEPRPYPDHVSGTFMDKSQIHQHIRDKMKADRDKARATKAENEKAKSVSIGAATYIETIYGTKTFARALVLDDAQSIMDLMDDFSDYNSKPLQSRISELEAKVKRYEEAFISIQTLTVCYDLQPFHKHICEIIEDHNKVPKPTER